MAVTQDLDPPNSEHPDGCGPLIAPLSESTRPIRQQIFERVRAAGSISRAQISKELGVSPASVTTQTSELITSGILYEISEQRIVDDAARGRPPVALGVRPDAYYVVGIKLSDREHTAVVVDFAGNLLASATVPSEGAKATSEVLDATADLIDRACSEAGIELASISAIGIGLPGFVDSASGKAHWSPVLVERDVNFADAATRHLGAPVTIDNDANLVALAELWFGVGRQLPDFAVVTIEHGVGMGLVVNHRLYRGAKGLGMELGHIKVQLDGALCRCGQRGCLEAYIADYALGREATAALDRIGQTTMILPVLLESLFDNAKAGNTAARSIFRRAGRYLALGLANVVNLFDPALIILSGERMRYDYLYAEEMMRELEEMSLNAGRGAPRIEVHAWGDLLWAHGAAALALSSVTDQHLGMTRTQAMQ
ncbi:MAG: ROK family protein [Boseongicola sp.]